jgi:hypothetical protein
MEETTHIRNNAMKVGGRDQVRERPGTTETTETKKASETTQVPEKPNAAKAPRRRLVPNLPAIEKFLKKDLGKEFAGGLKERDKKMATNATAPPPVSLDAAFQAMLLTDVKARADKRKSDP